MNRARRCAPAGTAWARPAPTEPRPCAAARSHAAPPSLPCAAARPTRPTIPRAPRPWIRPTARAPALRPLRLHRLRAAPGCPRPSMSPSSRSRIVVQVVAIGKSRAHRPHRAHRAPPPAFPSRVASAPGPLAGKNRTVCIPFSPNARKRPPSWQHPPEMHAFRDQDGNIFAPCIHFRAQSGDSGYMARESCRQGPSFASRNPKSRMTRRCCQRRPAFPRQRPAVRPNGLCAMRQRHATRGMAERALRPAAWAWPACRMRGPCHLACARRPRSSPPSYTRRASPPASRPPRPAIRRAAHCSRGERRLGSSCRPRAAHADASRPSMRARRHCLGPNPRQPSPSPEPTGPRPPVEPPAPIRAPPLAAPHPAARVPLRFR